MDPTKPILDLYGDYDRKKYPVKQQRRMNVNQQYKQKHTSSYSDVSYIQLKQKYQDLYDSYNEKVQKLNQCQFQVGHYKSQNQKLKQQIYKLNQKNQQLNSALLTKNTQLQDAYRRLQEQLKKGSRNKKNQQTIDRLQDGLKQAININFQHLKQASLAELKRTMSRI